MTDDLSAPCWSCGCVFDEDGNRQHGDGCLYMEEILAVYAVHGLVIDDRALRSDL